MKTQKSKKELYEDYLNFHDLENLISEMTNSVVHSQDPNPIVYMIKYLAGLLTEEERIEYNINILPPFPQGYPIVKFPNFQTDNILKKYLNKDNWYTYKHKKTSFNNDINNLTYLSDHSKTDNIGIILVDNNCISSFSGLIEKIIYDVHEINPERQGDILYKVGNSPEHFKFNFFFYDLLKKKINDVKFIFYRNIDGYTYNNFDKRNGKLKTDIEKEIQNWISDGLLPKDMNPITNLEYYISHDKYISKEYQWMKEAGLVNKNYTLKDRAIYSNNDNTLLILINFSNHFEIISTTLDLEINKLVEHYSKIMEILKQASIRFTFDVDPKFGYLTSNISLLGAGLKLLMTVEIPTKEHIIKALERYSCEYEIENDNKIRMEINYKLKHQNINNFLGIVFIKTYILTDLMDSNLILNFDKLQFKDKKAPMALAYDSTFNENISIINFKGTNINDIMTLYKEKEDDQNFILSSSESYFLYYSFIKKYIQLRDGINIEIYGHINKPEDPRDISNIESRDFIGSILKLKISVFRNISSLPFPVIKNFNEFNKKSENIVLDALKEINSKNNIGIYITLDKAKDIIKKYEIELQQNDNIKNLGYDDTFPEHRGIIQFNKSNNIYAIINDMNNMTFILNYINPTIYDNIREGMENLICIINTFSYKIPFSYSSKFGFLTAQLKYMGTGIKIYSEIRVKTTESFLNTWIKNKHIKYTIYGKDNNDYDLIRLENISSFGLSETEMLCNWLYYLNDIAIQ